MIKEKFKEVLATVLPISLLVVVLNFTVVPLETNVFIRFLLGAIFILLGLTIFLIGVDLGITPMAIASVTQLLEAVNFGSYPSWDLCLALSFP